MKNSSQTIGIIGGGQLGAMLIRSAIDFGLRIAVMDKDPDAPCSRYASAFVTGDPMQYESVLAFGRTVDILTIEKEAVNVPALLQLEREGITVHPSPALIGLIQDKWTQKKALASAGIPVVPGIPVDNLDELRANIRYLPVCLKLRKHGYDGRGVMVLRQESDLLNAFTAPCVLEDFVAIEQELSILVSRNAGGVVECYDPVLMIFDSHRNVLDYQVSPADIPADVALLARSIAARIAEEFSLVGILAVEMFVTTSGELLVNELAPRPHNSGHHTIEACVTSQYEQHIRAILGLPPGDTRTLFPSAMINVLQSANAGEEETARMLEHILRLSDTHLHWYGKTRGQEGRKMGHITVTRNTMAEVLTSASAVRRILGREKDELETGLLHDKTIQTHANP